MTIEEKFNLAETKIRQPRFLENRGMGNEVGYYIFDYDPTPSRLRSRRMYQMNEYKVFKVQVRG